MATNSVEVRPVSSRRDWKAFYRVKVDTYRNDPAAVIPLRSFEYALLDDSKHPFYQHATRQAFIAWQGNKPVGRIVAIKDDLHNENHGDQVGFFGFFESPNDPLIAKPLLAAAEAWLRDRGLEIIRGPVNPSMKGEFGVLVEGHDYPPFIMMGHTPKYYASLLEGDGFSVIREFIAKILEPSKHTEGQKERIDRLDKLAVRIANRFSNLRVEKATPENVGELIKQINVIGNDIRSEGWGFNPLTEAELEFMVKQVRRIIDPRKVIVAYVNDEIAGYVVTVPDVNWAFRKAKGPDWLRMLQLPFLLKKIRRGRCIAFGAARKYRHNGMAMVLAQQLTHQWLDFDQWEFSWIDTENMLSVSALDRAVYTEPYKKYQLFERTLRD